MARFPAAAMQLAPHIEAVIRCPDCGGHLRFASDGYSCPSCLAAGRPGRFDTIADKPRLVRADNAMFSRDFVAERTANTPVERRRLHGGPIHKVYRSLLNSNRVGAENARRLLADLPPTATPLLLEIGGGTPGQGSEVLRGSSRVRTMAFDVYASPFVDFVADAHHIPLADGSIDAVWIQAVLEHVVDPARVVSEIHRVLAPGGLVYAETPFMQQVHEGAHDFTRFTHSGHRHLFRAFEEIASGPVGGAGTSLIWAIRYFARTLTGNESAARLAAATFFWLRFFDRRGSRRHQLDAASGVYFLGRKSDHATTGADLREYYEDAGRP